VKTRLRRTRLQRDVSKSSPDGARLKQLVSPILLCAIATGSFPPAPVHAELMQIEGTVAFDFLALGRPPIRVTATGVADVNAGGSDIALNTLDVVAGISGSVGIPVTDPEVTASVASIRWDVSLGTGSLRPFASLPLTQNRLPLRGSMRLCLVTAACGSSELLMPFTQSSGAVGIGIGGSLVPTPDTLAVAVSIEAAPWTVGPAFLPISTSGGGTVSIPSSGYLHGPFSFSGSAALAGGELKLVSPVLVRSAEGLHPLTSFATINIRFVPEPGVGLLLVVGVVALLLVGRGRITP